MTQQTMYGVATALLVLHATPSLAQSGSARYRFTTLFDSQDGLVPASCAAINSFGTVAVLVEDPALDIDKLGEPSLNDLGRVVFTATLDDVAPSGLPIQGVFTGSHPIRDKVLQAGDVYHGVPVSNVFTCSEALNNLGQIVMTVQSEDRETFEVRTFVVKATPRVLHNVR